jgi:membrane protease YdiL (CAAX protease family)
VSEPPVTPALPAAPSALPPVSRRVVAVGEILLCSSVPTQLAIGIALRLAGLSPFTSTGELSFGFVVMLSLADTAALIALMVLLTRAHGESPAELWLDRRPFAREVWYGILMIPVVLLIATLLLSAMRMYAPWLHNVQTNPLEQLAAHSATDAAIFGLVAIVAGGLREELQRAFLLRRFEQHLGGATLGVLVLSTAFGLGHIVQGWDAVITTGTLGAFWAVVYVRRRSTIAPIVSHSAFNSLEILRVAVGS